MTDLHCPRCGYSLRGNTSGQCPECGQPATYRAIAEHLDLLRQKKYRSLRVAMGVIACQSIPYLALCHFISVGEIGRSFVTLAFFGILITTFIVSTIHGIQCAEFAVYDDFVSRGVKPNPLTRVFVAGVFFLFPMIIQSCFLALGVIMVLMRLRVL